MTLSQSFSLFFTRLFSITGRSSRAEYWWPVLCIGLPLSIVLAVLDSINERQPTTFLLIIQLILSICNLFFIPLLIRRLHDRNMSGWWALLLLLPLIGSLVLLVILVLPSDHKINRFGVDPTQDPAGHFAYYQSGTFKTTGVAFGHNNGFFGAGMGTPFQAGAGFNPAENPTPFQSYNEQKFGQGSPNQAQQNPLDKR